jgi:glutamate formiminotransferase / formiminotetrahydrofolate cyclodeaminase
VVEEIRKEATLLGVGIHHSELVGLIPQEALIDSAVEALQLRDFKEEQILEYRLHASRSETTQGTDFVEQLAASSPTPGGGAAAAQAGAMAAALVSMVARLTIGKPKYAAAEAQMNEILKQSERLRAELTRAVEEDSAAFNAVMAAFRLPKDTPEQQAARTSGIESATLRAAQVPLEAAQKAVTVMALAERCTELGNLHAISDAASAASLAQAALTCAGYNVRINLAGLNNKDDCAKCLATLSALEKRAAQLEKDTRKWLQERGGLSLA